MNKEIYYFSSTGNSQQIASLIAQNIDAEVLPMSSHLGTNTNASTIGLIFPSFFGTTPLIVSNFIDQLKINNPKPYIFAVVCYGGYCGNPLAKAKYLLEAHGLKLNYGFTIPSVENYILDFSFKLEEIPELLYTAQKKAVLAAQAISEKTNNENTINDLTTDDLAGDKEYLEICQRDDLFYVKDSCNSCSLCVKLCPIKNLELQNGKPVFKGFCQHCLICLQWCPKEAIEYNGKTQGKARYRNPAISPGRLNRKY